MRPKTFLAHIKFTISTMMREAERKQGKHYSRHQYNTLSRPLFLARYKDLIWDITYQNFHLLFIWPTRGPTDVTKPVSTSLRIY